MAQEEIGLSIKLNANEAIKSVGNLKRELKEAERDAIAIAQHFGEGSQQAINAAKNVAGLRDSIGDAKALMDAFNPDRKFQAFSTAIRGAASGFTALQGAMGLFGGESEEVQKTLLKVQSALAFSEGLNSLTSLGDGFKVLKSVAVNAFQGIKGAIAATGIGLLVVAIGTIVAYWDDIKEAVWGTNSELEKQNKLAKENLTAQEGKVKAISDQENILRLQGKSEKEILQMKVKQTDEAIKFAEISLETSKQQKEAQVAAAKRNRDILAGILKFTTAPLQLLIDGVTKVANFFGADWDFNLADEVAGLVFDPEDVAKEGDAVIQEAEKKLTELKNQRAGFQLSINGIDKQAAKDAEDRRKEAMDKFIKDYDDKQKAIIEYNKWLAETEEKERKEREEAALKAEKEAEERRKAVMGAMGMGSGVIDPKKEEEKRALLASLLYSESELKLAALQSEYERRLVLVKGNKEAELELDKWLAGEQEKIDEEKKRLAWAKQKATLDMYSNTLGQAASLFSKHTAAYKVLATAQAIIDTYTSAVSAYKSMAGIPVVGPVLGGIAAAAAIKAGYENIKAINKVNVPGASGGVGGIGMSAPAAPIQPQLQTTTLNQNQVNQIGNAAAGGVGRAYVLNGDIQSAAQRDNAIQRAATIG